jgi:hypothetical protein
MVAQSYIVDTADVWMLVVITTWSQELDDQKQQCQLTAEFANDQGVKLIVSAARLLALMRCIYGDQVLLP